MPVYPQYDMEQMIANIKRRCAVPTSQLTYTLSDMTDLCTDTLQGEVVPLLMSTREEYFVEHYDLPVPSNNIIEFPNDTVASKVRSVCYVQQQSPLVLINLPRIDLDIVAGVGFSNYATLTGFYIEGNKMVLYPSTSTRAGTNLRIFFYKRSLVLASPQNYGRITSIDTIAKTATLDYVPPAWTTSTSLNAVSSLPPFAVTAKSVTPVSISSPTIEFSSVSDLTVGDYLSLEGYSAIPQIPIEAHAYLAQLTAAKLLEGLGDFNGMKMALDKATQLKDGMLIMLSQRVDGSVKKIMNPTGGLRLGASIGRWGRGWTGGSW